MRAGNFDMDSNNSNLRSYGLDNMVTWYGHIPQYLASFTVIFKE